MSREVEMHQAYLWTCDDCGRDQFERAIPVVRDSLNEEDKEAFDALSEGVDGVHALMAPQEVTCRDCGAKFRATYGDEEENHEQA